MKHNYAILLLFVLVQSCNEDVSIDDVLTNLTITPEAVLADGQTVMEVKVRPSMNASADRRNIIFKTTGGAFVISGKSDETVKAVYVNGELLATANLRAPISPGEFTVSAEPEFDSPISEYRLSKTVIPGVSLPAKINAETSSVGIGRNAFNEVKITGTLLSDKDAWVTSGVEVTFEDLVGGIVAGGQFRAIEPKSSISSTVSAYYSAGDVPIGTSITIKLKTKDYPVTATVMLIVNQ